MSVIPRASKLPRPKGHIHKWAFIVMFNGMEIALFTKSSGVSMEMEDVEVAEGGARDDWSEPGRIKKEVVTLEHGAIRNKVLYERFVEAINQKIENVFGTIDIVQCDVNGQPIYKWRLYDAYIKSFKSGDWDNSVSEAQVEEFAIKPNGIEMISV